MKLVNLFNVISLFLIISACNSPAPSSQNQTVSKTACCDSDHQPVEAISLTIDELFANPEEFNGKTVSLKGLCIHTCRHSGKRMFMKGSDETQMVLITAGNNISVFDNALEGSEIIATGVIQAVASQGCGHDHGEHSCSAGAQTKQFELLCDSFKPVT